LVWLQLITDVVVSDLDMFFSCMEDQLYVTHWLSQWMTIASFFANSTFCSRYWSHTASLDGSLAATYFASVFDSLVHDWRVLHQTTSTTPPPIMEKNISGCWWVTI
jgi:hypothetical protein